MDYITEIFNRANIQDIREFLLHGVEEVQYSTKSYKERIDESRKHVNGMIYRKFPDMEENEKIMDSVLDYGSEIQDVYMEVGLQCGFMLAMQILSNDDKK